MKQTLYRHFNETTGIPLSSRLMTPNADTHGRTGIVRVARVMFALMLLAVAHLSSAQQLVSGTVSSSEGELLPGVTVLVKGTAIGTITDLDGNYKLELPDQSNLTLVYSFIGYATKEVDFTGQTKMNITLETAVSELDEVVVIGYGAQKRSEMTTAVASVSEKDFLVGKIQDASDLIKGKVAGLVITKSSGDPNATSNIVLRGINSIYGGTSPLILVDGVPADINTVAPESIESISVLKDGSSAAIYGTRGANGVIIITTKNAGRDQKAKVSYTGYVTGSDFLKTPDFMGPSDIRKGLTAFSDGGYDTDWLAAITQMGFTHRHVMDVQGGSKNSQYSANVAYRYEDGTIIKTNNEQVKVQLNLDQYFLDDKLKVGVKLWKDYRTNSITDASSTGPVNVYRQALIRNPTSPIYNEDGSYYEEERFQYYNPVSMLNEYLGERVIDRSTMIGTITLEPITNWKTNLMVSQTNANTHSASYETSKYFSSVSSGIPGAAYQGYSRDKNQALEFTSEYKKDLAKHGFTALAGYSYYYNVYQGFGASNSGFSTDLYLYNNLASGERLKEGRAGMSSYKNDNTLVSFFGRIHYSYADKYHLMASTRREGSSKFGANYKWGVFPAVSVGWTLSEESFLKSITWIDNLKLRTGYGVTGRFPGDSYISILKYNYESAYGNYLNADGEWVPSLGITSNANPNLKWETTEEINIGLDFTLFKSRINGALDVYQKITNDMIYDYAVPVPPNPYNRVLANAGQFKNRGIELMLSGSPVKTRNFEWNTTVTMSHTKATLVSLSNDLYETNNFLNTGGLGDPVSVSTHRLVEGDVVGRFWGLKAVDISDDGIWMVEDPLSGEVIPYSTSLNTDEHRQYLGNGLPKIYLGFNNTFTYKNWDLNIQTSGQFGFQLLNEQRVFYENNSIQYNKLKSAADPVFGKRALSTSQAQAFVSYYIEDADFLKFDNVTVGYNFTGLEKYVQRMRVYASAQNFLILTGYSGLDPELANFDMLAPGIDPRDKYPTIRSFTLGLNVTFK